MHIDSQGLETFLAVVRYGSVSAAAAELRRTQSAVSQRLRQLEDELGVRLFNRGRGRAEVALTVAGEGLLPLALRWELLFDELRSAPLTRQSVISMGATPMIADYLLAPVFRELHRISHTTTIRIVSAGSAELYAKLERREIDFAYVSHAQRMSGVAVRRVATEDYCIATNSPDLVAGEAVDIRSLDHRFQIYLDYGPDFHSWYTNMVGRSIRYNVSVNDIRSSVYFLANPLHWCVVPRSVAAAFVERFGIPSYDIVGMAAQRSIYQAYLEDITPVSAAGKAEVDTLFSAACWGPAGP
jgi:DNA-binding transcriptional LysR family regulator